MKVKPESVLAWDCGLQMGVKKQLIARGRKDRGFLEEGSEFMEPLCLSLGPCPLPGGPLPRPTTWEDRKSVV